MERRFDERRRRYLERYGRASEWRIEAPPAARLDVAVVIPAYDEQDELGETLARLFDAATRYDGRAYILCVANQSEDAAVEVRARNASMLHTARAQLNPQRFGLIDAVGEGRELPRALAGVGLARRIGCDALLPYCGPESVLAHLDADTHVGPDYFVELHAALLAPEPRAATLEFRHRAADERTTEALREYERFLQLTARRLAALGSPYGYVALGSAMASNVAAYLEVRGIPVRNAGEDFHFLQKLAKTCGVTPSRVHGSSRAVGSRRACASERVNACAPLSTGTRSRACSIETKPSPSLPSFDDGPEGPSKPRSSRSKRRCVLSTRRFPPFSEARASTDAGRPCGAPPTTPRTSADSSTPGTTR